MAQKSCKAAGKHLWLAARLPVQRVRIVRHNGLSRRGPPLARRHSQPGGRDQMAGRSWFYASEGQQQGPYPEIQLRELIARGTITADTLVWTEGMANWQRAGEIPGLLARRLGAAGDPAFGRRLAERRRPGRRLAVDRPSAVGLPRQGAGVHLRNRIGDPRAVGRHRLLSLGGLPPSCAGAAQSGVHRPGRRSLVGVRPDGSLRLCRRFTTTTSSS